MRKVIDLKQLEKMVKNIKATEKTIVLVGGCFDLLHEGHRRFLQAAKKQGDLLWVALENDKAIRRLKGQDRPINKEKVRASNLLKTGLVDRVILLPELKTDDDYLQMTKIIKPKIIAVTRNDPQLKNKQKQAEIVGAKIKIVIKQIPGYSTTQILKR
ncbi:MAG: adenylyltransferase/cytidyltransferase family protein [Patescibacteria group bacterium]|nr:adenylyltransferase/cytidyltransferase family protein [Patescibacteria group bacterium]